MHITIVYNVTNTHTFGSMKGSLIATTLTIGFFSDARSTNRPILPKPLIPTLTGLTLFEPS
jgi:hypothetical protein